jgi:hypothetical protein
VAATAPAMIQYGDNLLVVNIGLPTPLRNN